MPSNCTWLVLMDVELEHCKRVIYTVTSKVSAACGTLYYPIPWSFVRAQLCCFVWHKWHTITSFIQTKNKTRTTLIGKGLLRSYVKLTFSSIHVQLDCYKKLHHWRNRNGIIETQRLLLTLAASAFGNHRLDFMLIPPLGWRRVNPITYQIDRQRDAPARNDIIFHWKGIEATAFSLFISIKYTIK